MASLISWRGDWTAVWTRGGAVGRVKMQAEPIGARPMMPIGYRGTANEKIICLAGAEDRRMGLGIEIDSVPRFSYFSSFPLSFALSFHESIRHDSRPTGRRSCIV